MMVLRFTRDNNGSVLVEATIMIVIMFVFVLGSIDFLFAFYQRNAATKAAQVGARIAAVSDPVAQGLNGLSAGVVSTSLRPGSAMPSFTVTCDGGTATCSCNGACKGVSSATTPRPCAQSSLDAAARLVAMQRRLTRRNVRHLRSGLRQQMSASFIRNLPHQRGSAMWGAREAPCPRS